MRHIAVLIVLGGVVHATRSFRPHEGDGRLAVAATALAFGFLLLAALHTGRLFSTLRLPKIVGYIVTGIVVGPHLLELVTEPMLAELDLVNGVAVCLIAFTAGGELNFERLRPLLRTIRALTGWAVMGTCLWLAVVLWLMRPLVPFLAGLDGFVLLAVCGMLGVSLSAQSPAVVMALLAETRSDGPVSRTILGTVVIADLAVILFFGVGSSLVHGAAGGTADPVDTALGLLLELPGSVVAGGLIGALVALYLRYAKQAGALFVLLVCVVVSEVGRRIHLDPLVVMLAAGLVVENWGRVDAERLVKEIEAASLPVYLVFFALAGAMLHLDLLLSLGIPAAILVLARGLGFRVGAAIATRAEGTDPMIRRWAWTGLLPQAGLALALALIVRRSFPDIGEEASALMLAVIALNELLMPLVMRHGLVASGEVGQREEPDVGNHDTPQEEKELPKRP